MKTNSVDPDQMPHLVASELHLHCLHNTPKQVSGLKRVKGGVDSDQQNHCPIVAKEHVV